MLDVPRGCLACIVAVAALALYALAGVLYANARQRLTMR